MARGKSMAAWIKENKKAAKAIISEQIAPLLHNKVKTTLLMI